MSEDPDKEMIAREFLTTEIASLDPTVAFYLRTPKYTLASVSDEIKAAVRAIVAALNVHERLHPPLSKIDTIIAQLSEGEKNILRNTNRVISKSDWKVVAPTISAFRSCFERGFIESAKIHDGWVLTELGRDIQLKLLPTRTIRIRGTVEVSSP